MAKRQDAKAHPFPYQIALQTLEYLQGAVFYFICADEAAGEFIRLPGSLDRLKAVLLKGGMQEWNWDSGWSYLDKYREIFRNAVFQNVLVVIRSYWDWYITKLAKFIVFAREAKGDALSEKDRKRLLRINRPEILELGAELGSQCLVMAYILLQGVLGTSFRWIRWR